jgi:hypothetical protein
MNNEEYEKLLKAMSELLKEDSAIVEPSNTHRLTVIDITYDE